MHVGVSMHDSQKCSSCNKTTVFAMFYSLRNMPHTATKPVSCVAFHAFLHMMHGLLQTILAGIRFLLFKTTLQRGGTCEAHGIEAENWQKGELRNEEYSWIAPSTASMWPFIFCSRFLIGPRQDNVWFPNKTMCGSQTGQCAVPKHENREDGSDFDDFLTKTIGAPTKKISRQRKKSRRANDETTTDEKVYRRPFCYKSFRPVQNINAHIIKTCVHSHLTKNTDKWQARGQGSSPVCT